jgi:hypothetical protein
MSKNFQKAFTRKIANDKRGMSLVIVILTMALLLA